MKAHSATYIIFSSQSKAANRMSSVVTHYSPSSLFQLHFHLPAITINFSSSQRETPSPSELHSDANTMSQRGSKKMSAELVDEAKQVANEPSELNHVLLTSHVD